MYKNLKIKLAERLRNAESATEVFNEIELYYTIREFFNVYNLGGVSESGEKMGPGSDSYGFETNALLEILIQKNLDSKSVSRKELPTIISKIFTDALGGAITFEEQDLLACAGAIYNELVKLSFDPFIVRGKDLRIVELS